MDRSEVDNLFSYIESLDHSFELSISSGITLYTTILNSTYQVQRLFELAQSSLVIKDWIAERFRLICRKEIDMKYANRYDDAIATYLWVLADIDLTLAHRLSGFTIVTPNTWWSRRIATIVRDRYYATNPVPYNL